MNLFFIFLDLFYVSPIYISGGAGDASSVGGGSGRQHRISSMINTHPVYGASEVYGVPGISGGAGDASGVGVGSGSQHRNSSRSTHTVYGVSEVYGVPDSSGGAGDASGVGVGSGSQHRNRSTETGTQEHVDTASNDLVWTSMAHIPSRNRRQKLKRMQARMENLSPVSPPDIV